MTTERTLRLIERFAMVTALAAVTALAYATFTSAKADDTGACPSGKTLTAERGNDGVYRVICISTGNGR